MNKIRILRKKGPYDVIHIQYVLSGLIRQAKAICKTAKIVESFWGSDLFRAPVSEINKTRKLQKYVAYTSTDSIIAMERFEELYGKKNNSEIVYYGASVCEEIAKLTEDNYKKYFNIPESKIAIGIGYNARPAQQHIKVMQELKKLPQEIKDKLVLVFQMTYCFDDKSYEQNVYKEIETCNIDHVIINKYLSEQEIGMLRKSVDIFINSQTTDAFCNTVKEYLYAKATIINPSWLHYKELDNWNIKYIEYNNFSDLSELFQKDLNFITKADKENNKTNISTKIFWENCKDNWNRIYNGL